MIWSVGLVGLRLLGQILSLFSSRSAQIREYEKLVKTAILSWEKRTAVSSELRKDHRDVDSKLDQKWRDLFEAEQAANPKPPPVGDGKSGRLDGIITGPEEVKAGEVFKVSTPGVPIGAQIWRDKKWHLITIGAVGSSSLVLNSPADKVELWIKVDGVFQDSPHVMRVTA